MLTAWTCLISSSPSFMFPMSSLVAHFHSWENDPDEAFNYTVTSEVQVSRHD